MKKFFEKHALTIWIIAGIASIVVVHFLFFTPAPLEWMEARWSAGEILTYIGTVALSLLAVWQNKRFKEENDKSQNRLEELVKHSNELNLINKIIEIEYDRLKKVKEAVDDFTNVCDPNLIANELTKSSSTNKSYITARGDIKNKINQSLIRLLRQLKTNYNIGMNEADLIQKILIFHKSILEMIDDFFDSSKNNTPSDDRLASINKYSDAFFKEGELYIKTLEQKLDQVLYEDMSLDEIKKLYHD